MSADQLTKNERKGRRHENEARRVLNLCYRKGSRVTDTASPNGRTDLFHCADLIAVRAGWPVKLVQVKTNERPPDYHPYAATIIDNEFTHFEYWCRFDRQGWEIYAFLPGGEHDYGGSFKLVLELDTSLDESDARDRYYEYLREEWGMVKDPSSTTGRLVEDAEPGGGA